MESKSAVKEMAMDNEAFDGRYGDRYYFEAVRKIKKDSMNKAAADSEAGSLLREDDYCTMFMTF